MSSDPHTGDGSHAVIRDKTSALQAARAGVWDYDAKHDRLYYCRGAAMAFGLSSDARPSGLPLTDLAEAIVPEDRELYLSQVAPALQSGGAINAVFRVRSAGGSSRRLLVRGDGVRGGPGEEAHTSGIVVDLSEEPAAGPNAGGISQVPSTLEPDLIAGIDHMIAARACLSALDRSDAIGVGPLIDELLMNLGRILARKLEVGDAE